MNDAELQQALYDVLDPIIDNYDLDGATSEVVDLIMDKALTISELLTKYQTKPFNLIEWAKQR